MNFSPSTTLTHEPSPSYPSWIQNKYLLTGTFFLVWMFFFDPKDLSNEFTRRARLNELQKSEEHLSNIIKETRQELSQLKQTHKRLRNMQGRNI
jgi:hypothetical protein